MREKFPRSDEIISHDPKLGFNQTLTLATRPRLYSEHTYDFLKSDICVSGPIGRKRDILFEFSRQKSQSLKEKKKATQYLKFVTPYLNSIASKGMILGALARGSYFENNGFPIPKDNINFVLFIRRKDRRTERKIASFLKAIPRFKVDFAGYSDVHYRTIKKGLHPVFTFDVVPLGNSVKEVARRCGRYPEYILSHGVGIELTHIGKASSAEIARVLLGKLSSERKISGHCIKQAYKPDLA